MLRPLKSLVLSYHRQAAVALMVATFLDAGTVPNANGYERCCWGSGCYPILKY